MKRLLLLLPLLSLGAFGQVSFSGGVSMSGGITLSSATATATTPTFSPTAGTYSGTQSVTISSGSCGSYIYWNTTGSPTTGDTHSTSASVASSETVYAKVIGCPGYSDSAVGSAAYTISAGGTFGSSSILDNFNRADELPFTNASWTCPLISGNNALYLQTNVVLGGSNSDCYWNVANFGPDAESYVTLSVLPATGGTATLFVRLSNAGSTSMTGYSGEYTDGVFTLYKYASSTSSASMGTPGSFTLSAGDSIGLEAIGSNIKMYYKHGAGAWTQITSATDATYGTSGRIGMAIWDLGGSYTANLDNFGGGTR